MPTRRIVGKDPEHDACFLAWLNAQFDFSQVPGVRVQNLAHVHESIRAVASLGASILVFELQHDDDFTINALRRLGEHWSEPRLLVESEPGIVLNIAAVEVPNDCQT